MKLPVKKPLLSFLFLLAALTCLAQGVPALEQLKADPVLVKCMLNGFEASLPIATDMFPYYRWNDLRDFYTARCDSNK